MTQWNLHRLSRKNECISRDFHVQRLMWALGVVEADPVADGACRVLHAVEALEIDALPFDRAAYALDYAVLLGGGRTPTFKFSYAPLVYNPTSSEISRRIQLGLHLQANIVGDDW